MKKVQNFQKKLIRMDQLLSFNKQDIKYEILREALEFMTEIGSSISVLSLFLTIKRYHSSAFQNLRQQRILEKFNLFWYACPASYL